LLDCSKTLVGKSITLRPLRADDFDALHAAASDPLIWEQHPDPLRYEREAFRAKFFDPALAGNMAYVVVDHGSGELVGSSRYYEYDAAKGEIAIGYTFLRRDQWGGAANSEMKKLMLDHIFAAGISRAWFHVGKDNMRSRKAMEKIGGQFSHEGIKTMFGRAIDYVFYRIEGQKI
jgi:RimJ/RimL family protein N-acetyltransferase